MIVQEKVRYMPMVSFIILSWNSERYLRRCLDSVAARCAADQVTFEIIVIDNGSTDASAAIVETYAQKDPQGYRLIHLDANRGTTYSRNLGLKAAQGEFICILDSDTEMSQGNLRVVFNILTTRHKVGIIAPRLLLPDGSVQHSVKRFPTLWHKLKKVPGIFFKVKGRNHDFYPDFPFASEREVDTAISACWFFRRELLDTVGLLDERIFYSPEDLDYSIRVRKAGFTILYFVSFEILHHTQQISHKKPFSKTTLHHLKGLIYYYSKHGGWLVRPQY